uniref:Uncharacterized protein n=1 Tax=Arundo donax TaxID=35708 RepID=A0A0A8YAX4_ARUDO
MMTQLQGNVMIPNLFY